MGEMDYDPESAEAESHNLHTEYGYTLSIPAYTGRWYRLFTSKGEEITEDKYSVSCNVCNLHDNVALCECQVLGLACCTVEQSLDILLVELCHRRDP